MNVDERVLHLVSVSDVLTSLRTLVRSMRQRENWTQAELAKRSGVPATTISRLERTGLVSTDALFRVLFAMNALDSFQEYLKERQRIVRFPKSLQEQSAYASGRVVQRVRHGRRPK